MSDERDPKVSQRYRELGAEEPSRALDQTILAAAHRAAGRPHAPLVTPAGRHRWYFALGAAAVLVLAVAITVQLERRQPDFEALPPAPETTEPKQATEERQREASPFRSGARSEVPRPLPAPKPAAPVTTEQRQAIEEKANQNAARDAAPAAGRIPPAEGHVPRAAPAPMPAAPAERAEAKRQAGVMADQAQIEPPERWLERIVQLRKEGKHEEADRQLAEFRKRHPGYKVPEAALQ